MIILNERENSMLDTNCSLGLKCVHVSHGKAAAISGVPRYHAHWQCSHTRMKLSALKDTFSQFTTTF